MDKKEQIILAAMKLFIENDIQATPMSAIAKAAKTGMGTIYNYFATKEELINSIFIYIKLDQHKHITKTFTNESIKKQFEYYYLSFNQFLLNNPSYFFFIDQFENSPILTKKTKEEGMSIIQPITDVLLKGQEQGIIKSMSIEELIEFLNGGIMGFIGWVLTNKKSNMDQLLKNQLKLAWDAVKD